MSKRIGLDVCYNVETSNLVGNEPCVKTGLKIFIGKIKQCFMYC